VASPLQGLLTDVVALGTSQLVGRTVEVSRPDGAVVARIERVDVVPSDPAQQPAPVLDPVRWWLDTIDAATIGVARLFGVSDVTDDADNIDNAAGRVDLLESGELTLREVSHNGRRVDRIVVHAVNVDAVLGRQPLVRSGPITLVATLTVDDVRTWVPPESAELARTLRLRADGRVAVGWKRGRLRGEVAGQVERHDDSVDVVVDRLTIAGREVSIPARWRQRRSLSTATVTALGAELRSVTVQERTVTASLSFAGWTEPISYDQIMRLQRLLVDRASRVVVDLVRGRNR
jgi:hypothetical protein